MSDGLVAGMTRCTYCRRVMVATPMSIAYDFCNSICAGEFTILEAVTVTTGNATVCLNAAGEGQPAPAGSSYPEVFLSCWGETEHTFDEFILSNCENCCKVYRCRYCRVMQTIHNPTYGCRNATVVGDNTPIGA